MVRSAASSDDGEDDSCLVDSVYTLSSSARGRETDTEIDGFSQAGETLSSNSSSEGGDQLSALLVDSVGPRLLDDLSDEHFQHRHVGRVNRRQPLSSDLESSHKAGTIEGGTEDGAGLLKGTCIEESSCAAPLAWAQPVPIQFEVPPAHHDTTNYPYRNVSSSCTLCTSMTNGTSGTGQDVAIDPRKATLSASGTVTSDSSAATMQMNFDRQTNPTALLRIRCVLLLVTSFVVVLVVFLTAGATWYRQTDQFDRWGSRPTMAPIPPFIAYGPTETHTDTGSEGWPGSASTANPTKSLATPTPAIATQYPTPYITPATTTLPPKTAPPSQHPTKAPTVSPIEQSTPETRTPSPTASPSRHSQGVGPTWSPVSVPLTTKPTSPPSSLAPTPRQGPTGVGPALSPTSVPFATEPTSPPNSLTPTRGAGPALRPISVPLPTKPSSPPKSLTPTRQGPAGVSTAKPSQPPEPPTTPPTRLPRTYTISPLRPTVKEVPAPTVANPAPGLDSRAVNLLAALQSVSLSPKQIYYPNNGDSPDDLAVTWLVEQDHAQLDGSDLTRVRQRYALAALWFHTATQPSGWTEAGGWLKAAHECLWYGVACENGVIHTIRMASNRMRGKIPDNLGLLSGLRMLYLQDNALSGTIPTGLALCTDLLVLQLASNDLSGTIPEALARLKNIRYVQLKSNKLSGSLSPTLSSWKDLEILSLGQNDLSGTIPSQFGTWTSLTRLRLDNNNFAGSIPSFSQWNRLVEFNMQHNDFAGSLPATIGILWLNLELFHVGENKGLRGILPVSYSNWKNLIAFSAPKSALTGVLPVEYTKWINIKSFDVSNNRLVGRLPRTYGVWRNLVHFRVSGNGLTGPIPESFSSWVGLEEFAVARNQLAGTLAPGFGAWSHLKALTASENKLNGMIPETASSWTEIIHLDVSQNSMTGIMPQGVVHWTNIKAALFQGNNIGGLVPFCIFGYDVKTLVADCDKSTCTCCTECCKSTEVGSVCRQVP